MVEAQEAMAMFLVSVVILFMILFLTAVTFLDKFYRAEPASIKVQLKL
jgi:hypothetical protein